MVPSKKGQSVIEAMFIVGTIMLIFILLFGVYVTKQYDLKVVDQEFSEESSCNNLKSNILHVWSLGPSAQIDFDLEEAVIIYPQQMRIETKNSFCVIPLTQIAAKDSASLLSQIDTSIIASEFSDLNFNQSDLSSSDAFYLAAGAINITNNQTHVLIK